MAEVPLSKESVAMPFADLRPRRMSNRSRAGIVFACIAAAYFLLWPGTPSYLSDNENLETDDAISPKDFDWRDRKAKSYLDYEPCYPGSGGNLECALLELPMDYFNGTPEAWISLAVVRLPAVVPVTDPQYGGAILLNPGGPGGSGIGLLLSSGESIRATVDANATEDFGKYFDLISFDPRGVGATQPNMYCVEDEGYNSMWALRMMEEGWLGTSDAAMGRLWSMFDAKGTSCAYPRGDGVANIKKYMNTAFVARDMLELVEKHGEWREKEAERLLRGKSCHRSAPPAEVPTSVKYKAGEEKLQYWGYSYGTYLGSTYAAMFPDRVERLVLDGVVDAYDYRSADWGDNLIDTEKVMDFFYFNCARVGYPACVLANETGVTTVEGVKQRATSIIDGLYHNPLPLYGPNPEVATYSDIRTIIAISLYSPMKTFPAMAKLLRDVESRNGTALGPLMQMMHVTSCTLPGGSFQWLGSDTFMGIACTDGDVQTNTTKAEFQQHYENLVAESPSVGGAWASNRLQCIHYPLRSNYRFEAPFVGNTSHPVLFVGNTMDPVTPNKFAHKMAEGFEGAVALTQDSAGHCSPSTFSRCTIGYIHDYFQSGAMPPKDTVCKADEFPFGPGKNGEEVRDVELMVAMQRHQKIADAIMEFGGGFTGGRFEPARKALYGL